MLPPLGGNTIDTPVPVEQPVNERLTPETSTAAGTRPALGAPASALVTGTRRNRHGHHVSVEGREEGAREALVNEADEQLEIVADERPAYDGVTDRERQGGDAGSQQRIPAEMEFSTSWKHQCPSSYSPVKNTGAGPRQINPSAANK